MTKKIEITYWWKCNKFPKGIPNEMVEALDETAEERILEMMKQGYISGDLSDFVNLKVPGHKTPQDGYECFGKFQVVKRDVTPVPEADDEFIIKEHLEYMKQGLIRNGAPSTITNRQIQATCGFNDSFQAFRSAFKKGMNLRELSSRT